LKLNLLAAYPFCTEPLLAEIAALGDDVRFLLDSGAFSAFTSGTTIRVGDYGAFIERLPFKPWRYFNLDIIGDAAGSDRHYQMMRDRGLHPVPIFTRGAGLDELERMYETSDMVGIGGLITNKRTAYGYAKAMIGHVGKRQAHLLGLTHPQWIQYLRPYSCDSTSFGRATRYGQMDVYVGDGRFQRYYSGDRKSETGTNNSVNAGPPNEAVIRAISGMGFDPYALRRRENWTRGWGLARWVSAASWVRYALDLERVSGTKLFFAGNADDIAMLVHCFQAARGVGDLEAARRATIRGPG
jgi:hypothetical protein